MVKREQFRSAALRAVKNIVSHGDTDIFPYPFESFAFFDKVDQVVDLIVEYDNNFDSYITRFPPRNINSLAPVAYSGFRWATQIDPIWNAHFLASVIALSKKIELARPSPESNIVFSYRYRPNNKSNDLFDRNYGWVQFMERSSELSNDYEFVTICDISEFYPRLNHHRLENSLQHIAGDTKFPSQIIKFLSMHTNTMSFGLPVGGPAARILSELTINQIDRLLIGARIKFTRFADDYHIFSKNKQDAYKSLIFLSEKLLENQGLSLQKSKTRIMSSAEFRATSPLAQQVEAGSAAELDSVPAAASQFTRFSLKFDPYSPNAQEDYEKLKEQVSNFNVLGMLKSELSKTRVHSALAKKLITAVRFLDKSLIDQAIHSILENHELLYPVFSSVLIMVKDIYEDLSIEEQHKVVNFLMNLIESESHIFRLDIHLSYSIRIIAKLNTEEVSNFLQKIYTERPAPIVRRDIILAMVRFKQWYWLSDLRNRFRELSSLERRAFVVASYMLRDEGRHWRDHIEHELDPFEKFIQNWASESPSRKG